jgi:inosose dehydratase
MSAPAREVVARPDLRARLRGAGDALPRASIGTVPILWNNVDLAELRHGTDAPTILDEIARTGYEGTQLGIGFPEGRALRDALADRGLRLAEVYVSIPATVDGPARDAMEIGRERLRLLHEGGGEVLVMALDVSPGREERSGRASEPATAILTDAGWDALFGLVDALAAEAVTAGHRAAFHPHGGTFVETPAEVERLVAGLDPGSVGICLDVGHYLAGGGDPVAAMRAFGERVTHVHLKDVDTAVLARLRSGEIGGFGAAIRARLFTELGAGALDLDGVLCALAERDYAGWLMVEQDSGWGPPSESAAIGRRVLASALRRLGTHPDTWNQEGR